MRTGAHASCPLRPLAYAQRRLRRAAAAGRRARCAPILPRIAAPVRSWWRSRWRTSNHVAPTPGPRSLAPWASPHTRACGATARPVWPAIVVGPCRDRVQCLERGAGRQRGSPSLRGAAGAPGRAARKLDYLPEALSWPPRPEDRWAARETALTGRDLSGAVDRAGCLDPDRDAVLTMYPGHQVSIRAGGRPDGIRCSGHSHF